jgi:serine/threonine protein kinase
VVDEIKIEGITFARKKIELPPYQAGKRCFQQVQQEIQSIKALRHPHIISINGDYQENYLGRRQSFCLLMHPGGDEDLKAFFDREGALLDSHKVASVETTILIQKWFRCLSSALAHIHSQGVRH